MKHRSHKLPHKSGGSRPAWMMTPVWSQLSFSAWSLTGVMGKVRQRLTRQVRAESREKKLTLSQRISRGIGRAFAFRPSFGRKDSQRGAAR